MMAALTLAVPSKGRLQEQVSDYLADAGATLKQTAGARGYRATLTGLPDVEVMLLSASEIASSLIAGDVHLGVTGEDLLREQAPELAGRIHLVKPLIATKYVQMTRSFFAHMGISDYRIVESAGATEGAPAAGTAEAIVDITTTGTTLAANGLKVLEDGTILESQAQLAASLSADWNADVRAAAEALLARLGARARAKTSQILRVRLGTNADAILAALALETGASVLSRPTDPSGEFAILCPRECLMEAVTSLRRQGCDAPATTQDADYVFDTANPLFAELRRALG
jgi:ATP phosphoribosyltransferase